MRYERLLLRAFFECHDNFWTLNYILSTQLFFSVNDFHLFGIFLLDL